ncbi:MAG: ketoacyl-ACP synthase III [Rickettsiales bacterium]|nr:ketoacyl-ACP synthase III [Rickettsiales bacterium]
MFNSKIISTGSYLPKKIYDNNYMASIVDTSDEWITERTGIKERHIASEDEVTTDLALQASISAINNYGIDKNSIDAIVFATTTPDRTFPSCATILQKKLEINNNCVAFDIQAVCCGFIYALDVADSLIKSGKVKTALVVGAETLSRITNWEDRNTCVLFGDGAGCVILQATENKNSGILATSIHADGNGNSFDILNTNSGVSYNQKSGFIEMQGKEVFKVAVTKMSDCVLETLHKANLTTNDVSFLIPHQANQRIISGVGKKLDIEDDRVISTVAMHGNTSSASVPLALDYAVKNNKLKDGNIIVLEALGAGLTWGSVVVRW